MSNIVGFSPVHSFYSDCDSAYKALLSCFIKPALVKQDATAFDPSNNIEYLTLFQLCLGMNLVGFFALKEYKAFNKDEDEISPTPLFSCFFFVEYREYKMSIFGICIC